MTARTPHPRLIETAMTAAFGLGLVLFAHGAPANAQGNQAPTLASAKPGDVRVLCSTAFHWPADLLAQAEKAIGKKIVVEYGGQDQGQQRSSRGSGTGTR